MTEQSAGRAPSGNGGEQDKIADETPTTAGARDAPESEPTVIVALASPNHTRYDPQQTGVPPITREGIEVEKNRLNELYRRAEKAGVTLRQLPHDENTNTEEG